MTKKMQLITWMERENARTGNITNYDTSTLKFEDGMWWVKDMGEHTMESDWQYFSFDSWKSVLK